MRNRSNASPRPQADEIGAPKRPSRVRPFATGIFDAVTLVLRILSMESGRHKVRPSGDSFARFRTYWV